MTLREHKLWPLIEEVGLKKAFMHILGGGFRVPGDIDELRKTIKKYIELARTDYEEVIRTHANNALSEYSKMQTWAGKEMPRGLDLYNCNLPPATRRLYNELKKMRKK